MSISEPDFVTGTWKLHEEPNFNYQLNRLLLWSGADLDELVEVASRIHDPLSWEVEILRLAEAAEAHGRTRQAIGYYRMAEFFMFHGNSRKIEVYRGSRALFNTHYGDVFESGLVVRGGAPYEGIELPVWVAQPDEPPRDRIVLHGGFDSYIEEFLPVMLYLRNRGYEIYVFEGPGQGEVIREHGRRFTPDWHRPVGAVLDAFGLSDVTLVGVSLGGVLAPRAAAFDKRIHRVVAWGVLPNFLDVLLSTRRPQIQRIIRLLLRLRASRLVNQVARKQMEADPLAQWGIQHGMHVLGAETPYDYLMAADAYQIANIATRVDQDVLVLGATQDHFIPASFYKRVLDALTHARSLTFRMYTVAECAENHCNIGNTRLVLDTIDSWLELQAKVKGPKCS